MIKNNKINFLRIIQIIIVHILEILSGMLLLFTQLVTQFITALKKTKRKKIKNKLKIMKIYWNFKNL